MSNIVTDKIAPDEASMDKLTIGGEGQTVVITDSIDVNILQDSGGNTIFISDGLGSVTDKNPAMLGSLSLLSGVTASDVTAVVFTNWINNTYNLYIFKFFEIYNTSSNSSGHFGFQTSDDAGTTYNQTITTTLVKAVHVNDPVSTEFVYDGSSTITQSSALAPIVEFDGGLNWAGELKLYNPSSTSYVKHFASRGVHANDYNSSGIDRCVKSTLASGFVTTTDNVDAIKFSMSSGNFNGLIKLYGVKKS